jgi:hypothetical protein
VTDLRDLLVRLASGPRFLLLGQGRDRVSLAEREDQPGWFFPAEFTPTVGATLPEAINEQALGLYDRTMEGIPAPGALAAVLRLNWNGVFTTRIDSTLPKWLVAPWRRVVPTAAAQTGRQSRSPSELQVRFLFGGLALPDDEQPPIDEVDWVDWHRHATDTLNTLASSLITPKGVLAIEAWSPDDWLRPTDIYNLAARMVPGQVHIFSVDASALGDKMLAVAVDRQLIVPHHESLDDVLQEGEERGLITGSPSDEIKPSRLIPAGDGFVSVDTSTWNRILGSARPVDMELLEPFAPSSRPLAYQRFRTFLGSAEGAPPWRAVASGMKLPRSYERVLRETVEGALTDPEDRGPILLQGQTATGKSLALTWLAQELARSGRAIVLHQSRRRDRPTASDLELFSLWAEDRTGLRTVLIWDGMVGADEYFGLHRQLRARGQRVLIVGSSYLGENAGPNVVTAPIHLDAEETESLGPWLQSHGVEVSPTPAGADTSFLALLYRVLPETETGLRRGLALEMRAAETGMEAMSRERPVEPEQRMTAIARALIEAGMDLDALTPSDHPNEELVNLDFDQRSTAEQLSALILTAGRRGLNVPLELALRVIGREGARMIVEFMRHFDIFRWTEEADGGQFLGVRTRLEAELLAREDLSLNAEADVVATLIRALRPEPTRSGGDEVQFMVDLLDQIGPQSAEPNKFATWYGDFAGAFRQLRESGSYQHHRLVLLEANLLREHVQKTQVSGILDHNQRISFLRQAQDLLERTLEDSDASPRSRLNLYVELGATFGAQIVELANGDAPVSRERVSSLMEQALSAVLKARELDPENVYPVDVIAWSTRAAVRTGALAAPEKVRVLADAKASLDSLDPDDLPPRQRALYVRRQAELANLLEDPDLEAKYLSQLMEIEDPAAYYLLATRAVASGDEGVQVALEILNRAPAAIRQDWKCARLHLDLFWQQKTGARLLRGERELVPLTSHDWQQCLSLIDSLEGAAEYDRYRMTFVRGLAMFHLGAIKASQDEFRSLGALALDVGRRVILAYTASNPDGTPVEYTGRVASASADGRRGRVWVDQLRTEVDFVPLRFSPTDFRTRNEVLPTFHISFNYRGPIADPIRGVPRPGPR